MASEGPGAVFEVMMTKNNVAVYGLHSAGVLLQQLLACTGAALQVMRA